MRIAVAGSSGLIGTALVPLLRQSGHDVVRLVRRRPAASDEFGWDPPAGRIDQGALDGADAVVNLCGAGIGDKRWSAARKQLIRDSRNTPTEVLANAVAEHGVPVLVNGSAVGYYGDTGDKAVDETALAGNDFLAEVCRDWEQATTPASEAGARVVRIRSGMVLSPSGGALGKLRPLFSLMLGGRLGDGRQYWSWISLDDEVAAIRFVLENESVAGPVNLTAPTPVTNAEFTQTLGSILDRPAPWVVPGFALRFAVGEFADTGLLIGQRAIPKVLERNGFEFLHRSLKDALRSVVQTQANR